MKTHFKLVFLFGLLIFTTHLLAQPAPYESFSRLPKYENLQLSPDGMQVAFVTNRQEKGMSYLASFSFVTGKTSYLLQSDGEKVKLDWFRWANNKTIVFSAKFATKSRVSAASFAKIFKTRLLAIEADGEGKFRPLVKFRSKDHISQFQSVIDFLPDDPDHVLLSMDLDTPNQPSVYKVNLYNKKRKKLIKGRRLIREWFTDRQGQVRIGESFNYKTGEIKVLHRKKSNGKYETLFEYDSQNEPGIFIMGFGKDPNILYYKAYKDGYKALYSLDLTTKASTLLESDPDYDIDGGLIYSSKLKDVIGVRHAHADGGRIYWNKKALKFEQALDKAMPETNNYVVSYNQDETRYILYAEGDAVPGMYLLGDRKAKSLEFVFSQYPELDTLALPKHKNISYKARDGMEIEGYLTLPDSEEGPKPTIIFPHGGPGARDYAGFDVWTSFFANQGYVVLRPNFRGSSGYGYEFAQKQMKSWGLEMQDDLTDAANWLVEQNISDPKRMCIVGGSYGGYAAMMAAVKTPDLFKCSISFAGVSSLKQLISDSRGFVHSRLIKNQIGSNSSDLKRRSPYYNVEKIKIPMLLIHGEEDRVVDVRHSRMMADELEDEDKDVTYIELEDGDHYLSLQRNRHEAFQQMKVFLDKHL